MCVFVRLFANVTGPPRPPPRIYDDNSYNYLISSRLNKDRPATFHTPLCAEYIRHGGKAHLVRYLFQLLVYSSGVLLRARLF